MVTGNTFSKNEKLCSTKTIDALFSSGSSFIAYPLRVVFSLAEEPDENNRLASVLVSVPKRKFKRAVKRNRIKRLIREAYRLNKSNILDLLQQKTKRIDIAFLYLNDELPQYEDIEKAMRKAFTILNDKIDKAKDEND